MDFTLLARLSLVKKNLENPHVKACDSRDLNIFVFVGIPGTPPRSQGGDQ